jgi:hypothetical protein
LRFKIESLYKNQELFDITLNLNTWVGVQKPNTIVGQH